MEIKEEDLNDSIDFDLKPLPSDADNNYLRGYISKLEIEFNRLSLKINFLYSNFQNYKIEYEASVSKINELQLYVFLN